MAIIQLAAGGNKAFGDPTTDSLNASGAAYVAAARDSLTRPRKTAISSLGC